MSEEYRFKDRIKDIINGDVDYDKLRKVEKQEIGRASCRERV